MIKERLVSDVFLSSLQAWVFPFFNGNLFFSEPFGPFLRSMQIRFNNFMGRGGGSCDSAANIWFVNPSFV